MSAEQFVTVSYRGMEVGSSLKMIEFGPTTAYLEVTTPMPVGTTLEVATEAAGTPGVTFQATVLRIQEQVAGAEMSPGMRVRAAELDGAAKAWWGAAVSREDPTIPEPRREIVEPAPAAPAPAPEAVAEAAPVEHEPAAEEQPATVEPEERQPKRTQIMDVSEIQAAIAAGGDVAELAAAELSNGVPGGIDAQPTDKNPSGSNGDPNQPSAEESAPDEKKKRKRRRKRK